MTKNVRRVFLAMVLAGSSACAADTLTDLAEWLERKGGEMVRRAERKMTDGRIVYAPQAGDWYKATWLRDYVMTLEAGLVPKERQEAIAELFLSAVTAEGEGFDCIKFDGSVMRRPGYDKVGEKSVMDGYTYVTTLVYETWRQTKDGKWLRAEVLDKLAQMLDAMPHADGLPWIDPSRERERCPWGFTDSVGKTGKLLFMSLLEIRARRELAYLLREAKRPDDAVAQRLRATRLATEVNRVFWDEERGLYRAATVRCRQPDIWGSAYAVWLGVAPDERADRIARCFRDHYDGLVQNGQIRHLPAGVYWDDTSWNKRDFYQNGQFWGTATGWFCWTLERIDPALVDRTFADLVADYRKRGVNERTFGKETSCPDYLASAALPLQGIRRVIAARANRRSLGEMADWFEKKGRELVRKAERRLTNGTELVVYAPQTSNWYDGTWIRDYEMMVEARLIDEARLRPCAKLYLDSVSPEGAGVDNIRYDGEIVYIPRHTPKRSVRPVLDGSVYTVCLVYETWLQTRDAQYLAAETLDKLSRCLAGTSHDPKNGLAWIDPSVEWERCPWGFTDAVRKKGDCLYTSLLEIRARHGYAEMLAAAGRADAAAEETATTERLVAAINEVFWDEAVGLYRAATHLCTQHDIWGSAYAVWLGVAPVARADRIANYFKTHYDEIVEKGQIRQIPLGEWWDKTLYGKDEFQNGPYWGTATGWFCWTLERIDPALVDRTYNDLVSDYQARGVSEWVLGERIVNRSYLSSAALPLQGLRRLIAKRAQGVPTVRQVFRTERFTRGDTTMRAIQAADRAAWIRPPQANEGFFRFRRTFESDGAPLAFDVTADERFVLYLDGKPISSGPHRGQVGHWYYQTYEVTGLTSGRHLMEAVVWRIGGAAPLAQLSWSLGFLLKAEGPYDAALTTGKAAWEVASVPGTRPNGVAHPNAFGAGARFVVEGASVFDARPAADAWKPAIVTRAPIREETAYGVIPDGWKIFPTERKDQVSIVRTPGRIVNAERDPKRPFVVAAKTEVDYLWNLDDYICGYPQLLVSGGKGSEIEWSWTESLRGADGKKGDRNAWRHKKVTECVTDRFLPDGRKEASFTTPWWRCGKWCRLRIRTADEPLEVKRLAIREERYPLSFDAAFACDDPSVSDIANLCRRTMENCCHEMLMDCPFYEQQMYPGDTRIQLQVLNSQTMDGRMARFAMSVFDFNRRNDGFVDMNYPTRMTQESATFTLCWLLMFRDYAMWRDNAAFLRAHLPGVRNALMNLELYEDGDGLVRDLPGWCFVDWVDGWTRGVPPGAGAGQGTSVIVNLFYLLAQQSVADVEEALGEPQLAARGRERAARLARSIIARFWCERRGLVADTISQDSFSEHAQALAVLAGILDPSRQERAFGGLVASQGLHKGSASFCYYLFGAYARCGRPDLILKRLDVWRNYLAHGANTAFETQDIEARSDCHAWSACPLYCFQSVLAGVEPAEPFFRSVRIAPQPGPLKRIRAKTPSPFGLVETELDFADGRVSGRIVLPGTLTGTFVWNGEKRPLKPGVNEL